MLPAKKKVHTTTARPWWPSLSPPLPVAPRRASVFYVSVPSLPPGVALEDYKPISDAFKAPPAITKLPKPKPRKRSVPTDKQVSSFSKVRAPLPSPPPVHSAAPTVYPPQSALPSFPPTPQPLPSRADEVLDASEPRLARASASEDFVPLEIGDIVVGEASPLLNTRVLCAALQHIAPERNAAWWRQRAHEEEEDIRRWRADIEHEKAQMMGTWTVGLSVSSLTVGGQDQGKSQQDDVPEAPEMKLATPAKAKKAKAAKVTSSAKPSTSAQAKRNGKAKASVINATASASTVASPPSLCTDRQQTVRAPSQTIAESSSQSVYPPPLYSASTTYGMPPPQFAPLPSHHVFQRQESQGPAYPYQAVSQGFFMDQQFLDAAIAPHVQVPGAQPDPQFSLHYPITEPSLPASPTHFGIAFGEHLQGGGELGMSVANALRREMIDVLFGGEQAEHLGLTIDPALLCGDPPEPAPPPSERPTSPSERPLQDAVSTSDRSWSPSIPGRARTTEPSSERTLAVTDEDGEKTGDAKGTGKGKVAAKKKARREIAEDDVVNKSKMTCCHHCRSSTTRPKMLCVKTKPSGERCGKRFCVNCISKVSVAFESHLCSISALTLALFFPVHVRCRYKDIEFNSFATDFHCPYCLQTCVCTVCCFKRGIPYVAMPRGRTRPHTKPRRGDKVQGKSTHSIITSSLVHELFTSVTPAVAGEPGIEAEEWTAVGPCIRRRQWCTNRRCVHQLGPAHRCVEAGLGDSNPPTASLLRGARCTLGARACVRAWRAWVCASAEGHTCVCGSASGKLGAGDVGDAVRRCGRRAQLFRGAIDTHVGHRGRRAEPDAVGGRFALCDCEGAG